MDVGTPREIHLAFYSLIKLFNDVEVEQLGLAWADQPQLPHSIKAEEVQQVSLAPPYIHGRRVHLFEALQDMTHQRCSPCITA